MADSSWLRFLATLTIVARPRDNTTAAMQPQQAPSLGPFLPAFEIIRKILWADMITRGSTELIPHAGKRWMLPVLGKIANLVPPKI